jgi:general nucleoside transport system ATP-binding protein
VILSIQAVSKRFGSLQANKDISLELNSGEILGLLGENGAGKSTLVSILFGHYLADSGGITVFGAPLLAGSPKAALAAGIGMVHQHFTLADNLSVLDNILLGTQRLWAISLPFHAAQATLTQLSQDFGLKVDLNAQVKDLSVGEKQRVEILKVLYRGAKILVLDEPTAVLTPQESEHLFATLRKMVARGLAIILISHKLDEVLRHTDRIVVLRAGSLVADQASSSFTKSSLALAMVGTHVAQAQRAGNAPNSQPEPLLLIENLDVHAPPNAKHRPLHRVNLRVLPGRICAIAGVSGNGQQTLAQVLFGLRQPNAGTFTINGAQQTWSPARIRAAGVALIPEDRRHVGIVGEMSVWENAAAESLGQGTFSRFGVLIRRRAKTFCQEIIAQFDVRLANANVPAATLSGGNIQKLIIGRALKASAQAPKIIIADQPSWGLDVGAVQAVHSTLLRCAEQGAAVLFISEDLDEVLALADDIAVIHNGRLTPSRARAEWTKEALGLAMAGQTPKEQALAA